MNKATSFSRYLSQLTCVGVIAFMPAMDGEDGQAGCNNGFFSQEDAPDMEGEWAVEYADDLEVELTIGGAVYHETIGLQGGTIEIEHEGQPLTFDLDCAKEEVICPSEAWPTTVTMEQRNDDFPHQLHVTLPGQECAGDLVAADPQSCGDGTDNPDCSDICDGEVLVGERDVIGAIDEPGESLDLLLGAGVASNGINCALLGISSAHADIVSEQEPTWRGIGLESGEVITAYSGGCLWADDIDLDGELEGAVLGATVTFTTTFTGERL